MVYGTSANGRDKNEPVSGLAERAHNKTCRYGLFTQNPTPCPNTLLFAVKSR